MLKLMLRNLILFAILSLHASTGWACINLPGRRLSTDEVIWYDGDIGVRVPTGHTLFAMDYEQKIKEARQEYEVMRSSRVLGDIGVLLIFQKKYADARDVFLRLDRILEQRSASANQRLVKSERYSAAANLGTVYELLGEDANALRWIKKAIEINEDSHDGSEWLHARILEAKLEGENKFTSEFLLGTYFGTGVKPVSVLAKKELERLRDSLFFQLQERMTFVKPKDAIVARLLFDLANIDVLLGDLSDAAKIYQKAREYGFSEPSLQLRLDAVNAELAANRGRRP